MADIDYDRLSEALADAITRAGNNQDADIEAKRIIKAQEALDKLTRSLKETSSASRIVEKLLKGQTSEYNSLQQSIKDLEDQINATKSPGEEKILREKRNELTAAQNQQNRDAMMANATLGFAKITKEVGNSIASTTGGFVKGVQDSQSGFQLSAGLMSGAVDVANQGVQAAAAGIQGVGQIAAGSTKPALRGLGIAAQIAGVGLGFLGNTTSKLAKFGIEVLSKELEKTVVAYQRTSSSGALFADGLQGMRNAAGDAGLTVDQFSNVISRNSETLASSGLGVGEASRRMGQVGKVLKEQGIDRKLLNLGYSFEEQAELSAEVMSTMRRSNSAALLDPSKIAKTTEEYATNLRVIAAITGEDAKKKMAEVKQLSAQAAMRSVISDLSKTQSNILVEFEAATSTMPKELQTAVSQMMTLGAVTDPVAAQLMALSPAFADIVNGTQKQLRSGSFEAIENQKLVASGLTKFREDMNRNGVMFDIGIAGMAGKLPELNNSITNLNIASDKMSVEAIEDARQRATEQKETDNKLTQSYINAAIEAQKLAIKLQTAFDPFIEKYATIAEKMLSEINKTFDQIRAEIKNTKVGADGKPVESTWEKTKRIGGAALESASTGAMAGGLALGGVASVPLPVIGTIAGSVVGAVGGGLIGGLIGGVREWFNSKEGKARGGIARGPNSGFLEKLHGSEAIVPLPDGKSIPVAIRSPVIKEETPEEPKSVTAMSTALAVPKEPVLQPVNVTLAVPKEPVAPPMDITPAVPKETPKLVAPVVPAMPKESTPAFATQRSELAGIENIENMARSFVERPTDRLDAGFDQFLSDIRSTLSEAKNITQAKQPAPPDPNEIPTALALKETIEQTNAVLSDLMREHTSIMRESLARVTDLVSVSSDTKNINQQLLNNSY